MSVLTTSRRFILALAFALFASQTAAMAHGSAYGDDPHEHGGQICSVALVAPDGDVLLPVPAGLTQSLQIFTPPAHVPVFMSVPLSLYAPRPPPQRGPPQSFI